MGLLHGLLHDLTPTRWYSRVKLVAMSPSPGVAERSRSMQSIACDASRRKSLGRGLGCGTQARAWVTTQVRAWITGKGQGRAQARALAGPTRRALPHVAVPPSCADARRALRCSPMVANSTMRSHWAPRSLRLVNRTRFRQ